MATDEQGRELSDDGSYYWDGSAWQLVQQRADTSSEATAESSSSTTNTATDEQGRPLSDDGNYYWDGSTWQPVQQSGDGPPADVSAATAEDFLSAMNVEPSSEIGAMPA